MNIFRLIGDLAHLVAIIVLLLKIWRTRSCAGKVNVYIFNLLYHRHFETYQRYRFLLNPYFIIKHSILL